MNLTHFTFLLSLAIYEWNLAKTASNNLRSRLAYSRVAAGTDELSQAVRDALRVETAERERQARAAMASMTAPQPQIDAARVAVVEVVAAAGAGATVGGDAGHAEDGPAPMAAAIADDVVVVAGDPEDGGRVGDAEDAEDADEEFHDPDPDVRSDPDIADCLALIMSFHDHDDSDDEGHDEFFTPPASPLPQDDQAAHSPKRSRAEFEARGESDSEFVIDED